MRFSVLTLFPEMFTKVLGESILGRAAEKGILQFELVNIRDFSEDKHRKVDDYPYGGGTGLVMGPQPIYDAYQSVADGAKVHTVYMSPQGKVLNQKTARRLANLEHLVILCGHYEGVDERVLEEIVDEEISIGDYVLTGGEIPAMALMDCVARMVPGVLPSEEAYQEESHYNGLLEYPHYTRPPEFHGREVPPVLLSGHHKNISRWRREQSLLRTWLKRPDMLRRFRPEAEDQRFLALLRGKRRKTVEQIESGKRVERMKQDG